MTVVTTWTYINVWKGVPQEETRLTDSDVQADTAPEDDYVIECDLPHLKITRWLNGNSIHIYIHDEMLR